MDMKLIIASIAVFLVIILALVAILLVAKRYLVASGPVKLTINGENELEVESGSTLLNTLSSNGIFLSSACGGKGSCGQCKCQVVEGGGEILPSEKGHFSRKQQMDHWRLGCQVKVKGDMAIKVDESVMGVKEWECEVISNKNVATFIKEYKVALPPGEHMDFEPGSYAQIKIPAYSIDYDKDFDKSLIGDTYLPAWQNFGLFNLKCTN
ncbi:MAG: 2Fe-2S iron-sulfur cluster binding domain-containing protein, partial [Bacteroidaceae bacterium]|nr:2Fe-2S iron-sulfur cluster binding domain-containing protein [Bacteroidaceae bacterium]